MTKPNLFHRVAAMAAAATGACLLALASPHAAAAAGTARAAGRGEETPLNLGSSAGSAHSTSGSGASIVRTIVGLAIVIAVIWGLSWILRQVKSGREPHAPTAGLSSIAALTLSSGRSVHLVRAGNDYLLLGSAEHGVMPIHRYSEEQAREAGLLDVVDVPARPRRPLLRPPAPRQIAPGSDAERGAGHDPMHMPSPGPGSSVLDRLRELTVRK